MPDYVLTPEADSDLEDIARYTIREWGTKQAAQYAGKLERCFKKIAGKEARSRSFSDKFPEALVTRCEHHYVFYLHPEGKRPVIFAILHERMDFLTRLKERLR